MSLASGKMYYSISEVCQATGLEQHVLRYWETEFPSLKPKKNRAGNRAYRAKEIDLVKFIKHLLYDQQFTIQGAKKKLAENRGAKPGKGPENVDFSAISPDVKSRLMEIRDNLLKLRKEIGDILKD